MPRNSAPRFTKVYAGGYRAIASVNKSAAVLAVLMQYSDSPKPRGGDDPRAEGRRTRLYPRADDMRPNGPRC